MRQYIILSLLLSLCRIQGFGQEPATALHERVYLQTDKQLYLSGEIVWIKALTVTPERTPLSFSKLVYVELLNETTSLQQVKIGLSDGAGEGWMRVPLDLPSGYYRLVGYTRLMRNEGPDVFFETVIGVVNTFRPVSSGAQAVTPTDALALIADRAEKSNTITLSLNKQSFTIREAGQLQLDGLPDDVHTLSVSIAGKQPIPVPGSGGIMQWYEQVKPAKEPLSGKYIPEYEGHIVTGKIVALDGFSQPGTDINAFLCVPGEHPYLFTGKRNGDDVSFYLTDMTGVTEIVTTTAGSSDNYRIEIQSPFIRQHIDRQLPYLPIDSTHLDELLKRSIALQLLPNPVRDTLAGPVTRNTYNIPEPSKTYKLDEYTRFPKMDELIIEFVLGVRFRMRDGKREIIMAVIRGNEIPWITPLVLFDGIPIKNHELIYQYNPHIVEKIDLYMKEYVFGGIKYDGVISFSTYTHSYPELILDNTYQIIDYAGTQPKYNPVYTDRKRQPDFRHTLLWNPFLQTAGESSLQIPFYTSDYTGDFVITIEGLTKTGKPVYATLSFMVE